MSSYTSQQIRGAILRAADRIERQPTSYDFMETHLPGDNGCNTPHCMLGWIGYELRSKQISAHHVAAEILGMDTATEYNVAANSIYDFIAAAGFLDYQRDAKQAADGMRKFADRYFPAEKAEQLDPAYLAFRSSLLRSTEAA